MTNPLRRSVLASRSTVTARAADRLAAVGIGVHHLDGGTEARVRAGLPVQRGGGGPGTVA